MKMKQVACPACANTQIMIVPDSLYNPQRINRYFLRRLVQAITSRSLNFTTCIACGRPFKPASPVSTRRSSTITTFTYLKGQK